MGAYSFDNSDWEKLITEISEVISKTTGNVLGDKQRPMVESRLKKRCMDIGLKTSEEYSKYWKANRASEDKVLVGLLTTHFTSFFREFSHFEWIAQELPSLVAQAKSEGRKTLKFWSSAASKGQEVWSLCMWLELHLSKIDPTMQWMVLGSDIDEACIKEADNGVYHRRELETAPRHLWENYWVRGSGEIQDWYKIKSNLKSRAKFQVMSLLDITLPITEKFDVILCRNVLIYFDQEHQKKIVSNLVKHLIPAGTLITGMSESLTSHDLPLKGVSPTVYKLLTAPTQIFSPSVKGKTADLSSEIPSPLKIMCIDDSPTVISILKKVLVPPQFELIATAKNGQEALDLIKTVRPDAITLDLHMPVIDGKEFLKLSGIASTVPVIVVSSVERDHSQLIGPLFDLGVCDFVEKPTLDNMKEISEELSQKIKMGWLAKKKNIKTTAQVVKSRKRPSGHIIFNFSESDSQKVIQVISEQEWKGDQLTFIFNGALSSYVNIKDKIREQLKGHPKIYFKIGDERPDHTSDATLWFHFAGGILTSVNKYRRSFDFLIVEETSLVNSIMREMASDMSPVTSFSYLADKLLGGG